MKDIEYWALDELRAMTIQGLKDRQKELSEALAIVNLALALKRDEQHIKEAKS